MLPARAQDILLATLTAATLLGGSRRAQRRLLADAYTVCGRRFDAQALRTAMEELLDGQGLGTQRAFLDVS
jgi:hypothetical protein